MAINQKWFFAAYYGNKEERENADDFSHKKALVAILHTQTPTHTHTRTFEGWFNEWNITGQVVHDYIRFGKLIIIAMVLERELQHDICSPWNYNWY